jgi:hypothetical protein
MRDLPPYTISPREQQAPDRTVEYLFAAMLAFAFAAGTCAGMFFALWRMM